MKGTPTPSEEHVRNLRAFAGDTGLALGGALASGLLGFALAIVVTRGLGAAGAGAFFEAVAVVTIATNGLEFGADTGLLRSVSRLVAEGRGRDIGAVLRAALIPVSLASSVAALLMFAFAPEIGGIFVRGESAGVTSYIRSMALFVPPGVVMLVALAAVRGAGSIRPYVAIAQFLVPGLRPVAVGFAVAVGLGSFGIGLAWSLPLAVGGVLSLTVLAQVRRTAATASVGPPDPRIGRDFWRFTAPRGVAAFLQIMVMWIDLILLGILRSPQEAGVYAAATRTLLVGTIAMQAIALAVSPLVSAAISRDDRVELGSLYRAGAWWLLAMSWPFYITVAVFAPLVLRLFGPSFPTGATALVVLSAGMLVQVGTGSNKVVLLMAGYSGLQLWITALALAVNITLNLLLIPSHGLLGAAVAWCATFVVDNAVTTIVVARRLRVTPFGGGYAIAASAALVCFGGVGLAVRAVLGATVLGGAVFAAVATPLYAVVLWRNREALHLDVLMRAVSRRSRRLPVEADTGSTDP